MFSKSFGRYLSASYSSRTNLLWYSEAHIVYYLLLLH